MNRRRMALALLSMALAAWSPSRVAGAAETAAALDAAQRRLVVDRFAAVLEAHYVFPDVGRRYAARLREQLRRGAYDGLTDPAEFCAKLTADLQAISPDRHLAISPKRATRRDPDPPDAPKSTKASGPRGLEDARMIGDVAYLRFNEFPGEASAANARAFLLAHADARAVVIDSRPNRGGRLDEINAMLPLFFRSPARLYRMEMRSDSASLFPATPMIQPVAGTDSIRRWDHMILPDTEERRLRAVPVYYLMSRRTASAAEALALGLRSTRRATLVGETTAGAGYFGAFFDVGNPDLEAWISVGRTFDPASGWDWEGKGIRPDVEAPADDALVVALELARRAGAHPAP